MLDNSTMNKFDEVLSGQQPGQMVKRWKNQRFEDHLCPRPQGTSLTITAQPFDPADSQKELHHTQSPEKQQI
jgi:hypothetical protein